MLFKLIFFSIFAYLYYSLFLFAVALFNLFFLFFLFQIQCFFLTSFYFFRLLYKSYTQFLLSFLLSHSSRFFRFITFLICPSIYPHCVSLVLFSTFVNSHNSPPFVVDNVVSRLNALYFNPFDSTPLHLRDASVQLSVRQSLYPCPMSAVMVIVLSINPFSWHPPN